MPDDFLTTADVLAERDQARAALATAVTLLRRFIVADCDYADGFGCPTEHHARAAEFLGGLRGVVPEPGDPRPQTA